MMVEKLGSIFGMLMKVVFTRLFECSLSERFQQASRRSTDRYTSSLIAYGDVRVIAKIVCFV